MEHEYTPGSWTHYDDSADGKTNRHEIVALGKTICHIYHSVPLEDAANAKLIAAAPELLSALREMVEIAELTIGWFPEPPGADGPLIQARAAIAKATRAS